METVLAELIIKYPLLLSIVVIVGSLRIVMKPIFEFLIKVTETTANTWDNELLGKVMNSKAYSVVVFLSDYLASIKLPTKK